MAPEKRRKTKRHDYETDEHDGKRRKNEEQYLMKRSTPEERTLR